MTAGFNLAAYTLIPNSSILYGFIYVLIKYPYHIFTVSIVDSL